MKPTKLLSAIALATVVGTCLISVSPSYAGNGNSPDKPTSDQLKNAGRGGNTPGESATNGCFASGNTPKKCNSDESPRSVPEPASMVALGLVGAGLVGSRLQRRSKANPA